jgi:glycosyltransferase involved in cell wall biosynthesis
MNKMTTSTEPKVEILLATFNGEAYLAEQLDSIINQTYRNWTILVHDDGSTDNTMSIIKLYRDKYKTNIKILEDGITYGSAKENFFHLLRASSAPYIAFCDQDDIWFPDKIKNAVSMMIEIGDDKPALVHTDLIVVDSNKNTISNSMLDFQAIPRGNRSLLGILAVNNVTGCTMMINERAKALINNPGECAIMHDWWIAASVLFHKGEVRFLEQPSVMYRQHENNSFGAKRYNPGILRRLFLVKKFIIETKRVTKQARAIGAPVHIQTLIYLYVINHRISNTFKKLLSSGS